MCAAGRKRWALYPPGQVPPGVGVRVDASGDADFSTPNSLQWFLEASSGGWCVRAFVCVVGVFGFGDGGAWSVGWRLVGGLLHTTYCWLAGRWRYLHGWLHAGASGQVVSNRCPHSWLPAAAAGVPNHLMNIHPFSFTLSLAAGVPAPASRAAAPGGGAATGGDHLHSLG